MSYLNIFIPIQFKFWNLLVSSAASCFYWYMLIKNVNRFEISWNNNNISLVIQREWSRVEKFLNFDCHQTDHRSLECNDTPTRIMFSKKPIFSYPFHDFCCFHHISCNQYANRYRYRESFSMYFVFCFVWKLNCIFDWAVCRDTRIYTKNIFLFLEIQVPIIQFEIEIEQCWRS